MKNLLTYAAIAFGAHWLYKKYSAVKDAYKNVKAKITGVRNIKATIEGINFDIDVALTNPAQTNIDVSTGGLLVLKEVQIYNAQNQLIGTSTPLTSEIAIPANSSITITDIPSTIATENIPAAIQAIQNLDALTVKTLFEVAGQPLLI